MRFLKQKLTQLVDGYKQMATQCLLHLLRLLEVENLDVHKLLMHNQNFSVYNVHNVSTINPGMHPGDYENG